MYLYRPVDTGWAQLCVLTSLPSVCVYRPVDTGWAQLRVLTSLPSVCVDQCFSNLFGLSPFSAQKILSAHLRKIYLLKENKQKYVIFFQYFMNPCFTFITHRCNERCWKWDTFELKIFKLSIEISSCKMHSTKKDTITNNYSQIVSQIAPVSLLQLVT